MDYLLEEKERRRSLEKFFNIPIKTKYVSGSMDEPEKEKEDNKPIDDKYGRYGGMGNRGSNTKLIIRKQPKNYMHGGDDDSDDDDSYDEDSDDEDSDDDSTDADDMEYIEDPNIDDYDEYMENNDNPDKFKIPFSYETEDQEEQSQNTEPHPESETETSNDQEDRKTESETADYQEDQTPEPETANDQEDLKTESETADDQEDLTPEPETANDQEDLKAEPETANDQEDLTPEPEQIPVQINDKVYAYLDDSELLTKSFSEFIDPTIPHTMHICIYRIHTELIEPFVTWLFTTTNSNAKFPSIPRFQCPVVNQASSLNPSSIFSFFGSSNSDAGDDKKKKNDEDASNIEDDTHTLFMNECINALLESVPMHNIITPHLIEEIYKGFIEYDQENVFVFFDCTKIFNMNINIKKPLPDAPDTEKIIYKWAIADEITKIGSIDNAEIEPVISAMFNKYPVLKTLTRRNGDIIESPILVRKCTKSEAGGYKSTYYASDEPPLSASFIPPKATHELFGDCFLFSKYTMGMGEQELGDMAKTGGYVPRFALIEDPRSLYLYIPFQKFSDEEKREFVKAYNEDLDVLSAYIVDGEMPLWITRYMSIFLEL
jgi:hypothetical protein